MNQPKASPLALSVGALAGQAQVRGAPLPVVAVAVVPGELGDALLTAVLLDPSADAAVHRAPRAEQEAPVRDLVDQRVAEHEPVWSRPPDG